MKKRIVTWTIVCLVCLMVRLRFPYEAIGQEITYERLHNASNNGLDNPVQSSKLPWTMHQIALNNAPNCALNIIKTHHHADKMHTVPENRSKFQSGSSDATIGTCTTSRWHSEKRNFFQQSPHVLIKSEAYIHESGKNAYIIVCEGISFSNI